MMQRNRGGQPGNQNARSHGFYSKKLLGDQKLEFEQAALVNGLDEEITLLRVKIKSLVENDADVKLIDQTVRTLARLVTTRHNTGGGETVRLQTAIESIVRDLAIPAGIDPFEMFGFTRGGPGYRSDKAQTPAPPGWY